MRREAVGALAGLLLLLFAAGSATSASTTVPAKSRWRVTSAELPANAGTDYSPVIASISCASPGNCVAVGSYERNSYVNPCSFPALVLTEKAGHWARGVEVDGPGKGSYCAPSATLNSVSCPSPGECVAVGNGPPGGLLLTEKAGHWAAREVALPANADPGSGANLTSVSCASAGNCTAVGTYSSGGLLLTEKRGHWARGVEAPLPADAFGLGVDLISVSCAADGSCSAAGSYDDDLPARGDASGKPLLLTNTGGKWHAVEAVMPPDGPGEWAEVTLVSCATGGNCSAIGSYNIGIDNEHAPGSVLLTEKAGKWGRGVKAKPPQNAATSGFWAGGYVSLSDISCASPGNCLAVGQYVDNHNHFQGTMVSEHAGKWRRGVEAVLPHLGRNRGLDRVSCASPGDCTAAGWYSDAHREALGQLVVTETAGSWARGVRIPISLYDGILAISCAAPGNCGAAGSNDSGSCPCIGAVLLDSSTKPCVVPRLVGMIVETARRSLDAHGCAVGKILHARSTSIERGHVISQTRQPGRRRGPWARVAVTVSRGP